MGFLKVSCPSFLRYFYITCNFENYLDLFLAWCGDNDLHLFSIFAFSELIIILGSLGVLELKHASFLWVMPNLD